MQLVAKQKRDFFIIEKQLTCFFPLFFGAIFNTIFVKVPEAVN
jgi:hypothetical protein